jgi:hypothetical protein
MGADHRAEMEAARAVAEESNFTDHRSNSRTAQASWKTDDQMAGLKQRLDELYQ